MKEWIVSDVKNAKIEEESYDKILGISWNKDDDTISCHNRSNDISVEEELPATKREIIRQINGIYDPAGSVFPVTLKAKLFMRKLWTTYRHLNWDDHLPITVIEEWKKIR